MEAYYQNVDTTIYKGNALDVLREMDDNSISCCITSPPYHSLRNYGDDVVTIWDDGWVGALGLEPSIDLYLSHLMVIFREVKRVLKKEGTCWVNMGTSYKDKCDMLIPERFAIKMVDDDGWILRNTIIWEKTNCLPQAAKDRFCNNFEYVYFFTKAKRYYFRQQFEPLAKATQERLQHKWKSGGGVPKGREGFTRFIGGEVFNQAIENMRERGMRTKRAVWSIPSEPLVGYNHFASFPQRLVDICLSAGCPVDGIVLDPFSGSGTTGVVAIKQKKKAILVEMSESYISDIMIPRLKETQPVLFGG